MNQVNDFLKKIEEETNPALKATIESKEEYKNLSKADQERADIKQLAELLELMEQYETRQTYGGHLNWFEEGTPYGIDKLPKHRSFFEAGAKYKVRAAISANRVGKSTLLAYEAVAHATGIYPSWWKGKRFNRPVKIWLVGLKWNQVREVLQTKVYGQQGQPGTGMIPADLIVEKTSAAGLPGTIDTVTVRHVSGRNSIIAFKACEQKIKAFQGAEVDFIGMDEEPSDIAIYNECFMRLMTTKGIMVLTFTPQNGLTEFLTKIYHHADLLMGAEQLPSQAMALSAKEEHKGKPTDKFIAVFQWSMYDVPWITEEDIQQTIATTPAYLLPARLYGRVAIGTGTVFPIDLQKIICQPFKIPDTWKRTYGMDADWQRTAVEWVALDPDTDIAYIYSEHYSEQREPLFHAEAVKKRGDWMIGNLDYAANKRSHIDGQQLSNIYRGHGLKLVNAEKAVKAGIALMWERMATGRLKIFSTCNEILTQIPIYRTDEKGDIIKEHDDCIDAARYALMGFHNARLPPKSMNVLSTPTFKEYRF